MKKSEIVNKLIVFYAKNIYCEDCFYFDQCEKVMPEAYDEKLCLRQLKAAYVQGEK